MWLFDVVMVLYVFCCVGLVVSSWFLVLFILVERSFVLWYDMVRLKLDVVWM